MKDEIPIRRVGATLDLLIDQQMSAVTFVQDYLQVDFDGRRMTLYVWPAVSVAAGTFNFGDQGYRDALCSLIARKVVAVSESAREIIVTFGDGQVVVDLSQNIGIEHMILEDTLTNAWAWW